MQTKDIESRLKENSEYDEDLISENAAPNLFNVINEYIDNSSIQRSELFRIMNIDRSYGYQILKGTRVPTRKHIIQLGLVLGLDVEALQKLLKVGGKEILYVRNPEDARIYYCVEHKIPYEKAEEFIWGKN